MLKFKKISEDTRIVMKDALDSDTDYYSLAGEKIRDMYDSRASYILNSANSCLLVVAEAISEPVLVADQGGWNGFIKSCEIFGKTVEYVESDDGLINIESLENYFKENNVKTLYLTSLAGYTAIQPLNKIQQLCKAYNITFILDISGSVGDEEIKKYGDIQISSTGSPKIINIENGGFINDITSKLELNKHLLKTLKADNITCAGIYNEIDKAKQIMDKTIEKNQYLKNKLETILSDDKTYNIIHPSSFGLNTMITAESKSKAKKLAYNIRKRIETTGNIITVGPNYNRIKRPSIIIEIKNLDVDSLTEENMDQICKIIYEEIGKKNERIK